MDMGIDNIQIQFLGGGYRKSPSLASNCWTRFLAGRE